MLKQVAYGMAVFAATVGMVGLATASSANATREKAEKPEKVTICHRTDAVKNPYVQITVAQVAVDGVAGNSGARPDHYGEHQGPVATSEAVATDLKNQGKKWGDIIPPVAGYHTGLNWTKEGQAIYNNNCNYVAPVETQPNVSASVVCVEAKSAFTITLVNNGTAKSVVSLNNETFDVAAGATVTKNVVDNGNGAMIKLVIDGKVYGQYDGTRPFFCKQGNGSVTPPTTTPTTSVKETTPVATPVATQGQGTTEVESLPLTGNVYGALTSVLGVMVAAVTAAASYALRARSSANL